MAEQCSLFGVFGGMVQLTLASLCLLSLLCKVYLDKRYREDPPREWLVFFLDTSKQGFSALVAHFMNLMGAVIISRLQEDNPCVWYFINLMIDTTLGVLTSYLCLKLLEYISYRKGWQKMISGNYENNLDEGIDLGAWALQLMSWGTIVAVTKWLWIILIACFREQFGSLGSWVLEPLEGHPKFELLVVMIFVPLVMNVIQFWIQDTFLKGKSQALN